MNDHGIACYDDPTIHACWCGYRCTDRIELERHVDTEREKIHRSYRITTTVSVSPGHGAPCGLELHSTPYADAFDAIEATLVVPDEWPGHFQRHTILISKKSIDFLADALIQHKLSEEDANA